MEQRQHAKDDVIAVEVEVRVIAVDLLGDAGDEAFVGQHHPLRESGGAGGVRQRDDVVRPDCDGGGEVGLVGARQLREVEAPLLRQRVDAHHLHAAFRRESLHFLEVGSLGDYQLRLRRRRLLLDLRRRVERVRRRAGGADIRSTQECEHEFRTVLEEKHDHFVLLDPHLVEAGADFTGGELHVRVGVNISGSAIDHARP